MSRKGIIIDDERLHTALKMLALEKGVTLKVLCAEIFKKYLESGNGNQERSQDA